MLRREDTGFCGNGRESNAAKPSSPTERRCRPQGGTGFRDGGNPRPKKQRPGEPERCVSVEVAGVEPSKIHTDNQQYIQTQKLAPTKTPRD